jgi:hypothetical protein
LAQGELIMEITKDTRVSDILEEYGDIADVMEVFGVKRVAKYSFRRMLTKALTVERAAFVHRVPLDEFIDTLNEAIKVQESKAAAN